jgi:hypothetical protein
MRRAQRPAQIYNLQADIGEHPDPAHANPEVVRELAATLERLRRGGEGFTNGDCWTLLSR